MSSVGKLALSVKDRRAPIPSDRTLVDVLQTKANWIWCPETPDTDGPEPPSAPDGEQCIVRHKLFYPVNKGRPTTMSLIVAADDYMALYVDGVMIQPADITHDWKLLYVFQVPLPLIQNQTVPSLLLGLRVINILGYVGVVVAAEIVYEAGDPDVFYTGSSDEWRGQRLFDEGWEQPWYNSDSWRPASNISQNARSPSDSLSTPTEVAVFDALPASVSTPSTPESCQNAPTPGGWGLSPPASSQRAPIEFSIGEFAGILIGSILGAIIVGAVGAYIIMRRQHPHRPTEIDVSDLPPTPVLSPFDQMVSSHPDRNFSSMAPPTYTSDLETPIASVPTGK